MNRYELIPIDTNTARNLIRIIEDLTDHIATGSAINSPPEVTISLVEFMARLKSLNMMRKEYEHRK